ncbi:MAG: hypothetical protein J6Z02_03950 [Lachnospiraceae bacterium]|nr:hypothetical protein [Lachnospiraceae bacterium]
MKKIIALVCIMALTVSSLAACGKKAEHPAIEKEPAAVTVEEKEEEPSVTEAEETKEDAQEETKEVEPANEEQTSEDEAHPEIKGYKRNYLPILDRAAYILAESDINSGNEEMGEGETALFESTMYREYSVYGNPLYDFGYTFSDLNADGYDELLIMYNTFEDANYDGTTPGKGSLIAAAYGLVDDQPKLLFEGWSRNTYQLRIDKKIANRGSAGAAYAITGVYEIDANLIFNCLDYYFTHEIDGDYENIGLYHNTVGTDDMAASELIEGDAFDEFDKECNKIFVTVMELPVTTFANYYDPTMAGHAASAGSEEEDLLNVFVASYYEQGVPYEFITLDESEYSQDVMFQIWDGSVSDFKISKLSLKDVEDDGNPTFDEEVVYELPSYGAGDSQVVATMSFPGDTPSYGYSYKTASGEEKKFSLSLSGLDGSLVTSSYR